MSRSKLTSRRITCARPNVVPGQDPNDGPKTIDQWFNTAAFVLQPQFTHGNAERNSIIGPGIFNFDMSIMRNFRFAASKNLQLRLEAFNAFNQPVWGEPNTSVTSPNYGRILSTRKPMRELQFGVKFAFYCHAREAAAEMPPPSCVLIGTSSPT